MEHKKVVILGGGISGLSLAWYLKKKFQDHVSLTVVEKSDTVGGWIRTETREGYLFEAGPRSIRVTEERLSILQLFNELGLQEHVIDADVAAKQRWIFHQGKLEPIPYDLMGAVQSPFLRSFIPYLFQEPFKKTTKKADESVSDFFERRLCKLAVEKLIDPLTTGIWAASPEDLSMRACFAHIARFEDVYGSIVWGVINSLWKRYWMKQVVHKPRIISFKEGMQTLPKALAAQLKANFLLGCEVRQVLSSPEHIEIITDKGNLVADYVFSTLGPYSLEKIIPEGECRIALSGFNMTSLAVVHCGFSTPVLGTRKGFGYLVPSSEDTRLLGIIFDSCVFPQHNSTPDQTRLSVMLGGTRWPEAMEASDSQLIHLARLCLKRHLGIDKTPEYCRVLYAKQAIGKYHVGHLQAVENLEKVIKKFDHRIQLSGAGFYGASVTDCIARSQQLAEQFQLTQITLD